MIILAAVLAGLFRPKLVELWTSKSDHVERLRIVGPEDLRYDGPDLGGVKPGSKLSKAQLAAWIRSGALDASTCVVNDLPKELQSTGTSWVSTWVGFELAECGR